MTLGEAGVRGTDEKHFSGPTDLAWLPDGTFFVADGYVNSRIVKFDKNGKYLTSWGTKGIEPGQFNLPHGIDVDRNRRVYVADAHNSRIQVFDENGKFLDQWPNIWRPDFIMVSNDQHLWIAAGATDMMLKYDLNGKAARGVGQAGARCRARSRTFTGSASIRIGHVLRRGSGRRPDAEVHAKARRGSRETGWRPAAAGHAIQALITTGARHRQAYRPAAAGRCGRETGLRSCTAAATATSSYLEASSVTRHETSTLIRTSRTRGP